MGTAQLVLPASMSRWRGASRLPLTRASQPGQWQPAPHALRWLGISHLTSFAGRHGDLVLVSTTHSPRLAHPEPGPHQLEKVRHVARGAVACLCMLFVCEC